MKYASFDSDLRWDDPNLRWGDPSYILEPGDPGYVDPSLSDKPTTNKKNERKKMKHNNYYPVRQSEQIVWLTNFGNKIGDSATALGLSTGQVTGIKADCNWLVYVLQTWLPATRTWGQSCTDAATEAQNGTGATAQVLPAFATPVLPTGVTAVNPGALDRVFAVVQQIKAGGKCTETIGTNLGIIGSEVVIPHVDSMQPVLGANPGANEVAIKWGWNGHRAHLDSCEIHVDRGDGKGFALLTIDTTPNYTDTQSFPAALTKWTYRAIYRADDRQVGQWSNPVSVTVGG